MDHLFVDLECTCWQQAPYSERMEIIQIGAVKLSGQLEVIAEFNRLVRPVVAPVLSDFCVRLTSIQQEEVNAAELFPVVFGDFLNWAGKEPLSWYSWGKFDFEQLARDLERHAMVWPDSLAHYVNLKSVFAGWAGLERPVGMMRALRSMDISFAGRHHQAIDDARHAAKIAQQILRESIVAPSA